MKKTILVGLVIAAGIFFYQNSSMMMSSISQYGEFYAAILIAIALKPIVQRYLF